MGAIPIRLQRGESLLIRGEDGSETLWEVRDRKMSGYLLQCHSGGDARTWTDDEIFAVYAARRLKHFACNKLGIASNHAAMLDWTWEMWSEAVRRAAERRLAYVRHVDQNRGRFRTLAEAYDDAATTVFEAHKDEWSAEDANVSAALAAQEIAKSTIKPLDPDLSTRGDGTFATGVSKPSRSTIRSWFVTWNENGRDIRLLIPRWHESGRREPRERRSSNGSPDTYSLMDEIIRDVYLCPPRKTKLFAHGQYVNACADHGVNALSYRSFRLRILKVVDDRGDHEKRHGKRSAQMKFGVFERRVPPERPLQEVEVDHCLIDLIVRHPITGRILGRPWLTVIIDRASAVILGVHLSFEVPSYAALQRCLAHALWPKDLSGINGLLHDWPCHGLPEFVFTDNGKEFRSNSLQLSANALGFEIIPLPVKQPWLKGRIERLFGRMNVQVFSFEEGCTLSRTVDFYDPAKRATLTLPALREKILCWIVNEYHHERHTSLKCTPMERFRYLTSQYPVRPVPDFDHIIRLTGQLINRKISNVGIKFNGLIYLDNSVEGKRQLEALRSRRGGLDKEWIIRVDPYDIGEVHLLDQEGGRWLTVPCTDQSISRGVSLHQHAIHREIAQHNLPRGAIVTSTHIAQAMGVALNDVESIFAEGAKTATATKAARYVTTGDFFTPINGFTSAALPSTGTSPAQERFGDISPADDQRMASAPLTPGALKPSPTQSATPSAPDLMNEIEEMADLWTT